MAIAVLMMVMAMTLVPLGDAAAKWLMLHYGVSPYFVAWTRFALGALALLPFVARDGLRGWLTDWRVLMRGGLIVATICSILTALQTADMASVYGAFFVAPIVSYGLSGLLLGERIQLGRSILLLIGFGGVMLVVRPGFGIAPGLGFAVLAGVFYGAYLTSSRWLSGRHPGSGLMFAQLLVGSVVLLPVVALAAPVDPGAIPVMPFLISALASLAGNLLLLATYRRIPATLAAPFVYFQLIAASLFGIWIFGQLPDALGQVGLSVILLSGFGSLALRRAA